MRKIVLLLLFFTMALQAQDNIVFKKFNSFNLNSERILKIYLPDSYEEKTDNSYPIAILLDGPKGPEAFDILSRMIAHYEEIVIGFIHDLRKSHPGMLNPNAELGSSS